MRAESWFSECPRDEHGWCKKKGESDESRGQRPSRQQSVRQPSDIYVSPNISDKPLGLRESLRQLTSYENKLIREAIKDVAKKHNLRVQYQAPAIGEWQEREDLRLSEPTTMTVLVTPDDDEGRKAAEKVAAEVADRFKQKSVLVFHDNPKADDILRILRLPKASLEEIESALRRAGFGGSTIVPARGGGYDLVVIGFGAKRDPEERRRLGLLADILRPTAVTDRPGEAKFIGDETRIGSHRLFLHTINSSSGDARPWVGPVLRTHPFFHPTGHNVLVICL